MIASMWKRRLESNLHRALRRDPIVALVGPRRVGKSTLAREVARSWPAPVVHLDLGRPSHAARLRDPARYLEVHRDALVVVDEAQRMPELMPVLRALVDLHPVPGRFLWVGSATLDPGTPNPSAPNPSAPNPSTPNPSAPEPRARDGRPMRVFEMGPLTLDEVGASPEHLHRLWSRGGFPESFLAANDAASLEWRRDYVRAFLERDLPALGLRLPPERMRRFWTMAAHRHGQLWNAADVARGLGVSAPIAAWYAALFVDTFQVRRLEPLRAAVPKRLVKTPKLYLRDSGLLHALLDVPDWDALQGHPIAGFSWEGFVIEQVLAARPTADAAFYRTATGVELDLVVRDGGATTAFDVTYGALPAIGRALTTAVADLKPKRTYLVHSGEATRQVRVGVEFRSVLDLPG